MEDILDKPHQDEVFCRPINNKICSTSDNIQKIFNGIALSVIRLTSA